MHTGTQAANPKKRNVRSPCAQPLAHMLTFVCFFCVCWLLFALDWGTQERPCAPENVCMNSSSHMCELRLYAQHKSGPACVALCAPSTIANLRACVPSERK